MKRNTFTTVVLMLIMIFLGMIALKPFLQMGGVQANASAVDANSLAGEWLYQDRPCAIFQQGRVLLVVNENGAIATAQVTNPNSFIVLGGIGWYPGLVAEVVDGGKTINWANDTVWTRAR